MSFPLSSWTWTFRRTENEYLIRLSAAQEKVLDDCDRVLRHILEFQSKLKNAERAIKKYRADFLSWYVLAAAYVVEAHKVKFSPSHIKGLAEAEFTRLIDGIDVQVDNLISSVEHLTEECRQHKKIQSEKHNLGKDQANASWTSKLANPNGIAPSRADDMAQEPEEEELGEDEVPAFVSRRPQITPTRWKVENGANVPIMPLLNDPQPCDPNRKFDLVRPDETTVETEDDPSEPTTDEDIPLRGIWHAAKAQAELAVGKEAVEQAIVEHRKVVASNQDLLDEAKPGDTVMLRFQDNAAPVLESIHDTINITGPTRLPFKTGDPAPVTVVEPEQVVDFLNADEPEHVAAIAEVRKIPDDPNPDRNHTYQEPQHVSVCVPVAAQEVLADPKATPEQLKAAFAQEIVTSCYAHGTGITPRKHLILTDDEDLM